MATYTSFLNLEKPTTSERLDVLKINSNWDKIDAGVSELNSNLSTLSNSAPKRQVGAIPSGQSVTVALSSDFSANTEFAIVALNYSGNALGGSALIFLGRGTGKYKDLIGSMSTTNYTLTYSNNNTWTITNNSAESTLFYTAIITK